jgi:hypothetical protein
MNETFTTPIVPEGTGGIPANRPRIKFNLICASKCKKHAVELAKAIRPCNKFTRVSEEFLLSCEAALKAHIHSRIKGHPSKGKTLT